MAKIFECIVFKAFWLGTKNTLKNKAFFFWSKNTLQNKAFLTKPNTSWKIRRFSPKISVGVSQLLMPQIYLFIEATRICRIIFPSPDNSPPFPRENKRKKIFFQIFFPKFFPQKYLFFFQFFFFFTREKNSKKKTKQKWKKKILQKVMKNWVFGKKVEKKKTKYFWGKIWGKKNVLEFFPKKYFWA